MIRLGIVPKTAVLVVIRSGGNLGGDRTAELLLIGLLGSLDELLLFIVKVIEAASVLRSSIVALAHGVRWRARRLVFVARCDPKIVEIPSGRLRIGNASSFR